MHTASRVDRSAFVELGLLFLPGIPAYLWIWPNLNDAQTEVFQVLVYLYILAGTLVTGRRWRWDELGLNRSGLGLTLVAGLLILAARLLIILSINWHVSPPPLTWGGLAWEIFFYIFMVGLTEELLFRGVVYRLLLDNYGLNWAIWGSSAGFVFWHIFGQGPVIGFAALLIGLLFAVIRWRAGGIVGLIVLHGLWDLQTVLLVSESNAEILKPGAISFANPAGVWLGTILLFGLPLFLWLGYPRLMGALRRRE